MIGKEKLLEVLTPSEEPFFWKKYDLTIIGDGYLDDGSIVHMVAEEMEDSVVHLSNVYEDLNSVYLVSLTMIISEDLETEFKGHIGIIEDDKLQLNMSDCISRVLDKYATMGWIKG